MHYKNGEEAKVGHVVKYAATDGRVTIGTVVAMYPASTACNLAVVAHLQVFPGALAVPVPYYGTPSTFTAGDCDRVV